MTKSKLVNLNYILDYKLVIEKILKLAIRPVIKIYVVYSAQNYNITFAYITQFEIWAYIILTIFMVIICEYKWLIMIDNDWLWKYNYTTS